MRFWWQMGQVLHNEEFWQLVFLFPTLLSLHSESHNNVLRTAVIRIASVAMPVTRCVDFVNSRTDSNSRCSFFLKKTLFSFFLSVFFDSILILKPKIFVVQQHCVSLQLYLSQE